SKAGINRIVIESTGAIDAGALEVGPSVGVVTGEVRIPYDTYAYSPGYISCGIMDNESRFNPGYGSSSLSSSRIYNVYLSPNPVSKKYYLKAEGRGTDYSFTTSQYIKNLEIVSGETKVINFTLPGPIAVKSPVEGTTSESTTPVFSWTPPDPKFNLYIILLYEGGGSAYLKWIGVTDRTSITYPSFSSGSGFENLNLDSSKGYTWLVYGYYIPTFSLHSSEIKLLNILEARSPALETFSANSNSARAMTIAEMNQALEQTMSPASYFSTSAIPHMTTTSTSTTTTSTTTTIDEGAAR
ncbi:MAG: hypothetical protein ABII72_02825, partial [Parcubacteria group bacterium]